MSVFAPYLDETNSMIGFLEDAGLGVGLDLPRHIGFDRVKISSAVVKIDWPKFDRVLEAECLSKGKKRTLYAYECRTFEKALGICREDDEEHWYSSIQIYMGSSHLSYFGFWDPVR